ncbi:glycine zipper 2TM domain-containing protein [Lichenibacterium minor]|uniref:Glycine zipper 2TM domain-containing protein n=1 Tax=Lichenibacterium minor TaxID=2316528 RepID=A0A4V1RUB9_9HYPH|nr:glycine zipper 2TM domain-containing protein [Lichenibacterium minor]RYC30614.1 glycine zipper 2TM domain-containing protein [Lichenibacterium minor]
MRGIMTAAVLAVSVFAASGAAQARGCITGAIVGGIAGHAVHHGIAGAAAGCAAGSGASHYYRTHKSRAALQRSQQQMTPSVAQ